MIGHGLKKNIIYDLLNKNNIEKINPNSSFQWFNLDFLLSTTNYAKELTNSHILNVATEPVPTAIILNNWFNHIKDRLNWDQPKTGYDVRSIHGLCDGSYIYSAEEILKLHLKPYIETQLPTK